MNRPIPRKLAPQILDEASQWFVEFSEGTLTPHQRKQFIGWLRISPEHIRAYLQMTAHWEEARSLTIEDAPNIEELVALARQDTADIVLLDPSEKTQPSGAKSLTPVEQAPIRQGRAKALRGLAFAASAFLAILGAAYWFNFANNTFNTGAAEQRTITLADGSTMELNVQTRIRVALGAQQRDIYLTHGQALFHVAKDVHRPFVVHTDDTEVRAVGTQFDVYRKEAGTVVTVLEGTVAVVPTFQAHGATHRPAQQDSVSNSSLETSPNLKHHVVQSAGEPAQSAKPLSTEGAPTDVLLTAGDQTTVTAQGEMTPLHGADGLAATAWTRHQLVLHNTPLAEVVAEFNRYNSRQLVIVDPSIRSTRISGIFSSSSPDSLLRGLQALGFKIHELQDRVEITSQ